VGDNLLLDMMAVEVAYADILECCGRGQPEAADLELDLVERSWALLPKVDLSKSCSIRYCSTKSIDSPEYKLFHICEMSIHSSHVTVTNHARGQDC